MIISTLDPISMNDVIDSETASFVVESEGTDALKIYFLHDANKAEYQDTPLHTSIPTLSAAYALCTDSDIAGSIN